jgi:hypothetical protein
VQTFTEEEVRFLSCAYQKEYATGQRELRGMIDMRKYGCPDAIFNRILEHRARKLGSRFTEFRTQQNRLREEQSQRLTQPEQSLADRVAAAKLW